eukprot:gnl/MRDRNA2_/MRDRNA2_111162_c0_seq1.p1 gnl/MRDRNA2_/MRDRNA2_111162_c0~~gnl/MRDRNA2_/MRDRNA2_111162_c0_seq1.p1  ORF type:complete len:780 (-),score=174.34 gnl/MRDRNA2_/MRDRNA2_111162_c0_seq1:123-2462(-)
MPPEDDPQEDGVQDIGLVEEEEDEEGEDTEAGRQSVTRRVRVQSDPDIEDDPASPKSDSGIRRGPNGERLTAEQIEALEEAEKKAMEESRKRELFIGLQDYNYQVRRACVMKMKGLRTGTGSPEDISALVACLHHDVDEDVRINAVRAIWRLAKPGTTAAIHGVAGALVDSDTTVRHLALQALEELTEAWDEEKVKVALWYSPLMLQLRELSLHGESFARLATLEGVCKVAVTCDKEAVETVIGCLKKSTEWEVKVVAVKGIRQLAKKGDTDAISALATCVGDSCGLVRGAASEALPHVAGSAGLSWALAEVAPLLQHKNSSIRHDATEVTTRLAIRAGAGNAMQGKKDFYVEDSCVREAAVRMTNQNAGVRQTGIETMKRLAEVRTPGVVDAVIQALRDAKTGKERLTALQALLRASCPGNSSSFAAALPCLQDLDSIVRHAATEVLKHTAPTKGAAVSEITKTERMLCQELESSFQGTRLGALKVLRHLTLEKRMEGLSVVARCVEDSDPHLRLEAAEALQDFAVEQPQDVIAEMLPRLQHPEWFVRKAVAEVLGAKEVFKAALPKLSSMLAHKDGFVRRTATEALVAVAEKDSGETLQTTLLLFTHPLSDTRECAVEVIHRIATHGSTTAVHALANLARDNAAAVRAAALDALASLANRDHAELAKPLARSLTDYDRGVRAAAARALGAIACDSQSIVDLRPLLEDSDAKVRLAAIGALVQIGERIGSVEMAASAVQPCLKDLDERVREAAAEVVFCCSTKPAMPFAWLALESTKS